MMRRLTENSAIIVRIDARRFKMRNWTFSAAVTRPAQAPASMATPVAAQGFHPARISTAATADTDSVSRGALAALGFNYHEVGKETGAVVVRILNGEPAGDIPVAVASGSNLVVNKAAAEKMGVTLPAAILERANQVVE